MYVYIYIYMSMYVYVYIHIYIYIYIISLGDSRNTVREYCLDIPRFEESPNNQTQLKLPFEEQGD